jgi:hypothetical protein
MRLMGTKLHMTIAFHPQSDGQSEAANRVIIMYLRCLIGDRPQQWLRWLPWAEFVFNTAYQSSLRDTPFRVIYGRDLPSIRSYEPRDTRVAAVAKSMEERAEFLADIRYRLEQAQAVQKLHYDKQHRHVAYQVGDWALLRLRQRAASSLPRASTSKLKPRFYGPYRVTELINDVAVRLELPPRARLHDVFHIGLVKKFQGRLHHRRYLLFIMVMSLRSLIVLFGFAWCAACARCWFSGKANPRPLRHGRTSTISAPNTPLQLEDELSLEGGGRCHVGGNLH